MAKHALADEDKDARRNAIVRAALDLFLTDTRRFPSVAAIAAKAGLAKGTIYLYFDSKEQIFTTLLAREWSGLFAVVFDSFGASAGTADEQVRAFIGKQSAFMSEHPYFLRLESLGYSLLETNLSIEHLRAFKQEFSDALSRAGTAVDEALALPEGRGLELLVRSHALTRGLWQTADHPAHLREDPDLSQHPLARLDFARENKEALGEYWHGALAGRRKDPRG